MKIGNRLTFQFSLIVAAILILFSVSIYYFSQNFRKNKLYLRLTDRAITTARLLLEVKGVNVELLKLIDKNTNVLPEEQVEIYNSKFQRIYCSVENDTIHYPKGIFYKIYLKGEARFYNHNKDAIGKKYIVNNLTYIVLASAKDVFGISKLNDLKLLLVICLCISIIITVVAGKIFSKKILHPILDVIKQVDNITASNLNLKVDEGNRKDEIAMLASTFNKMLERLEIAFEMQRSFALNASHELRTPLTSVTGQIEIALMKKRDVSEYEIILSSILEDIKNLNEISNGLLDLVHSSIDINSLMIKDVRIDELILHIKKDMISRNAQFLIFFNFDELPEDENKLTVTANESLLKIAFINLIDNACKFSSNKSVSIKIDFTQDFIKVKFVDQGIGIPQQDMDKIFVPFFRAQNTNNKIGFGLGLPLVSKIINIHNGTTDVISEVNKGTTVTVNLPYKQFQSKNLS